MLSSRGLIRPESCLARTTGGLVESWTNAAMELLIAVGLVLFAVGTPSLFVAGTIYLNSLVGSLPDLGLFYSRRRL